MGTNLGLSTHSWAF